MTSETLNNINLQCLKLQKNLKLMYSSKRVSGVYLVKCTSERKTAFLVISKPKSAGICTFFSPFSYRPAQADLSGRSFPAEFSRLTFPGWFVQTALSDLSLLILYHLSPLGWPVLADLLGRPVQAHQCRLSYSAYPLPAVLPWLSSPAYPVPVLSILSSPRCPALAVQSRLSFSCPFYSILSVLSRLYYSEHPVHLSCPTCRVLAGLSWYPVSLSCPGCPAWMSCPGCPVLDVQSWLPLSLLSSSGRPVLAFLAWMSYPGSPSSMSLPFCHYTWKQLGLLPTINQMAWIFFWKKWLKPIY
jgi:hypothetical protein